MQLVFQTRNGLRDKEVQGGQVESCFFFLFRQGHAAGGP